MLSIYADTLGDGGEVAGTGMPGRCDVIVMATHGRGGLQRWAMGSITERVINATKLPILVVRPPQVVVQGHQRKDQVSLAQG
jgi:nucleotide-binding universal stress UspA family protein